VTPSDNPQGPAFDFSAAWSVTGTVSIESGILFRLESANGFGLTGVTLSATGSRSGVLAAATVTEVDCLGGVLDTSGFALGGIGSVACLGGGVEANTSALLPVGSNVNANVTASFFPIAFQVDVLKDVSVTGAPGGSASITNVGQQFTQAAPEPGSAGLVVIGLLAGAGALWRKRRKRYAIDLRKAPASR